MRARRTTGAAVVVLMTIAATLVTSTSVARAATAPPAPTNASAIAGDRSAVVSWTAPAPDGGSPVTGYVVTPYVGYAPQPPVTFTNALTTQTVTGLANGTTYRFRVRAVNAVGTSGFSLASNPVTPTEQVPSAPLINTTAAAGNGKVTVMWWANPDDVDRPPVTGFVVTPYIGLAPQPSVTFPSPATTQTVTGLTNGVTYRFRVRALSSAGISSYSPTTNPVVPVPAPNQATAIAVGGRHSCALITGGTVRCWGNSSNGQLGDGTVHPDGLPEGPSTPRSVVGITTATAIAAGELHTCALLSDGTVRCWGHNGFRQLGNGDDIDSPVPVTVAGVSGATAISADTNHTCALVAGGAMRCWGSNGYGQLGDGTAVLRPLPVTVAGISGATAIGAGGSHTCAVVASGAVRCWGFNGNGRLGNGTTTDSLTPVSVSGLTGATSVTAGGQHTCARLTDGTARCWGLNQNGRLGNGSTTSSSTPVVVAGLTGATTVAADGPATCARRSVGGVKCWGSNVHGQLGNGTTSDSSTPVAVTSLYTATSVDGSGHHACALVSSGAIRCWGLNATGQLGNGFATSTSVPVTVIGL